MDDDEDLRIPTTPEALAQALWKPIKAKAKPEEPEDDERPLRRS